MVNVNYNEMSNKTPETTDVPQTNAAPEAPKSIKGVVSGCSKLNVRKQPNTNSDVIRVIDVNTEVEIDEAKSTVDFYKVRSNSDTNRFYGYCMKKYISVT